MEGYKVIKFDIHFVRIFLTNAWHGVCTSIQHFFLKKVLTIECWATCKGFCFIYSNSLACVFLGNGSAPSYNRSAVPVTIFHHHDEACLYRPIGNPSSVRYLSWLSLPLMRILNLLRRFVKRRWVGHKFSPKISKFVYPCTGRKYILTILNTLLESYLQMLSTLA